MAITVKGVCFSYGRKRVLHDIDWMVRRGVTGLLGPNGSGKTTLLSVLIGLLRPTTGAVVLFIARADDTVETDTDERPRTRGGRHASPGRGEARFGFVPQRFSMAGGMRVVDAVAYTAWVNGTHRGDCEAAAMRALAAVDLTGQARVKVKTLSGGQRQRVGIAAGLAHDPDVLVLDEPTVGLDPDQRLRVRVRDMIAEIGRTRTVVVSTHLLDEVSQAVWTGWVSSRRADRCSTAPSTNSNRSTSMVTLMVTAVAMLVAVSVRAMAATMHDALRSSGVTSDC
jgi:ABC-2 type transport system ATP-binding protein